MNNYEYTLNYIKTVGYGTSWNKLEHQQIDPLIIYEKQTESVYKHTQSTVLTTNK